MREARQRKQIIVRRDQPKTKFHPSAAAKFSLNLKIRLDILSGA
jgi:hypothetical protein